MCCKYSEIISKMIFNINLRKLPSQYGEVSVMFHQMFSQLLRKFQLSLKFRGWDRLNLNYSTSSNEMLRFQV